MGCTDSRTDKLDEEKVITSHEHLLGFSKHTSRNTDLVFRKFAYNEAFNENQWSEVCYKLKLATSDLHGTITKFYKQFERNGKYDMKPLLLLSIMLTRGTEVEKAKLLFEIYDYDCTLSLERNEVSAMISDMINVAVDKTSILTLEHPDNVEHIPKLNNYILKLKYRTKDAVHRLSTEIMSGLSSLRQDMFIEAMKGPDVKGILTSSGMRAYLNSLYGAPAKPWESSNQDISSNKNGQ